MLSVGLNLDKNQLCILLISWRESAGYSDLAAVAPFFGLIGLPFAFNFGLFLQSFVHE